MNKEERLINMINKLQINIIEMKLNNLELKENLDLTKIQFEQSKLENEDLKKDNEDLKRQLEDFKKNLNNRINLFDRSYNDLREKLELENKDLIKKLEESNKNKIDLENKVKQDFKDTSVLTENFLNETKLMNTQINSLKLENQDLKKQLEDSNKNQLDKDLKKQLENLILKRIILLDHDIKHLNVKFDGLEDLDDTFYSNCEKNGIKKIKDLLDLNDDEIKELLPKIKDRISLKNFIISLSKIKI